MGGLALVFKQIQSVFGLLQFVFIALIVVPVDKAPFLRFLPLSWGVDLLGKVMMQKMSIFDFSAKTMLGVTLLSAAYFAAGIIIFKMCELQARKKGLFGHY
jgi:ABC-2 type transport system permease protein